MSGAGGALSGRACGEGLRPRLLPATGAAAARASGCSDGSCAAPRPPPAGKHKGGKGPKGGALNKTRGWVLKKKAQMRAKGYTAIPADSKYTARRRKHAST